MSETQPVAITGPAAGDTKTCSQCDGTMVFIQLGGIPAYSRVGIGSPNALSRTGR